MYYDGAICWKNVYGFPEGKEAGLQIIARKE